MVESEPGEFRALVHHITPVYRTDETAMQRVVPQFFTGASDFDV